MTTDNKRPGMKWWAGSGDEFFSAGPCETRDEAIKEGCDNWGEGPFYIMQAEIASFSAPRADAVLDLIADSTDDLFFEDGFPGFDGTVEEMKAAEDDLQAVLDAWLLRHPGIFPPATSFALHGAAERIEASATQETQA